MSAQRTVGTKLYKVKEGLEAADLLLANITKIGEIGIDVDEIDVTDMDSAADYKEFEPSFKTAKEITFEGFIKNEDFFSNVLDLVDARASHSFKIVFKSGSIWEATAFFKTFGEGEITVDGARTYKGSLRVSGKPVYTPASEISA